MRNKKDQRGGKRPGAGRKPSGKLTQVLAIRHDAAIISRIREQRSATELQKLGRDWLDSLLLS